MAILHNLTRFHMGLLMKKTQFFTLNPDNIAQCLPNNADSLISNSVLIQLSQIKSQQPEQLHFINTEFLMFIQLKIVLGS